jgi:hypothetical protein
LHSAGAVHHVEAELADSRHVFGHDPITAFRHDRNLGKRPGWRHAESKEADAERARHFTQLRKMRHQFGTGVVDGLDRRPRQFELSAGLERDRATAGYIEQADDVAVLDDRFPAEQMLHAFEQRADAAAAHIGNRELAIDREGEFLVLGADAEL